MLAQLFNRKKVDQDTLYALEWKKPSNIEVYLQKTPTGYFAKVVNFEGNVVTEAQTGQELFEMINDAIYEYLDIPEQYRELLGSYLPPEKLREELRVEIPKKYLDTVVVASV